MPQKNNLVGLVGASPVVNTFPENQKIAPTK